MIKALWFMIKVGLLAALAVWVASRPGFVRIEWLDYSFRINVGLFLVTALITILLSIFIYRLIRLLVDAPKNFRRYRAAKRRERGYRALTIGLTAVAAGDKKAANFQSTRAETMLAGDNGLPLLLKAQAARLDGREEDARKTFLMLLENKDAAFLGVRGLLQAALDAGNYQKALELAQQALKLHPKQPWILHIVYDLEIRQRHWEAARKTLARAEKAGAFTPEKIRSDRIAMLLAEAEDDMARDAREDALKKVKKAYGYDENFIPSVVRLARLYNNTGKRKKAVALTEKAWKAHPHPDLVSVWSVLAPFGKTKEPLSRMRWFEKLLQLNPDTAEGQMAAARIAMDEGLWGEARTHLKQAEVLEPTSTLYRLWAELEERGMRNDEAAVLWLEKAADTKPPRSWVCAETGRIYTEWQPVAQPHGAFNTIEWNYPQPVTYAPVQAWMDDALLEAPKA